MNSNICNICGLIVAYYSIENCYVGWASHENQPELTEEQVLGQEKQLCPECENRLKRLGISAGDINA